MNALQPHDQTLSNVLVPSSLIKDSKQFGGAAVRDCLSGDLILRNGRAHSLRRSSHGETGQLVLPKLTECHVHLDKCHTISRMDAVGGDLRAAIDKQEADKQNWTAEDLRNRASRGLGELIAAGCGTVRSHVDWAGLAGVTDLPLAWHVLKEVAEEHANEVQLQISPLIGIDEYAVPGFADKVAAQLAGAAGVLGAFVLDHQDRKTAIRNVVEAAEKHDLALDFHVDEGLSPGLDGLELIADAVIETGYAGPVLCGHACSLANFSPDDLARLAEKLRRANITIASLPVTNLYLQGRTGGTPDRRGLTRIRELRELGVPVIIGTDNVRDAFSPLGRHDPIESLKHAVLAAHLDPPFADHLPMVTTDAESAVGLSRTTVDGAAIDDLIIFPSSSTADLLSQSCSPASLSQRLKGETA